MPPFLFQLLMGEIALFDPNRSKRNDVERDGEARTVRRESHGAVPEIGRKQHQFSDRGGHDAGWPIVIAQAERRFPEFERALVFLAGGNPGWQIDIVGGTDPPLGMNMVGVKTTGIEAA